MRVEQHITIAASPEQVWEALADPKAICRAMGPSMSVEPDDPTRPAGLGGRYRVRISLGAAQVGGAVEIVDFDAPRDFAWVSSTGISHRLRLRIRPTQDGSIVTVRFSYDAPGMLGAVADVAALPRNRALVANLLANAKYTIELGAPPGPDPEPLHVRVSREIGNVGVLARAGIVAPVRPDRLVRIGLAARTWGQTLATGVAAGAARHPDRVMIDDEYGTLTYRDVDRRTSAVAVGLAGLGVSEGDAIGLMASNHRGFVDTVIAAAKLGADVLLLNTAFAAPQLAEVCERERPSALIYDQEFSARLTEAAAGRHSIFADPWPDDEGLNHGPKRLVELARTNHGSRPRRPGRASRLTILTSGTTGTPKGASRGADSKPGTLPSLDSPAGLLERIPLRNGVRMGLPAPLFHAWGLSNFALGLSVGATFVLAAKFDPEMWLRTIDTKHVQALVVVPVMLQRILQLPGVARTRHDSSSLRIVAASGSALPGDLASAWMDAYGDTLYNMYGSTEVAAVSIASPEDMRAAPGTAGRPCRGTIVKLLDADGYEVLQGQTGRIFVASSALFDGYTGGGDKLRIGRLMSTGDVGRFDESGRLFVQGRDDEMIVSGGENVFPKEVEDTLTRHPAVLEAAAIGVADDDFGQRLRAFVALHAGESASADELKSHVRDHLARYKVPREIVFVDALPRNATGKILKRDLAHPTLD